MSERPLIDCFQSDLEEVLDRYKDQGLTVGEVIGTLETVKLDAWREAGKCQGVKI